MSQTWMITGASSGLGFAFAKHALTMGYSVVATARSLDRLSHLVSLAPDKVMALALDVDRPEGLADGVTLAVERFGTIDGLINNAGFGMVGSVEDTSQSDWHAVMRTNFFGAIAMLQAVLPIMRSQKSGTIVNVSSSGGQVAYAGLGAYCASKFALEGMSEALAEEMAPFGIDVIILEPGAFRTGFAGPALKQIPTTEVYHAAIGPRRQFLSDIDNKQAGDPEKAARLLFEAIQQSNPPLRLVVGADAIDAVRAHAEAVLRDIADWELGSRATAF